MTTTPSRPMVGGIIGLTGTLVVLTLADRPPALAASWALILFATTAALATAAAVDEALWWVPIPAAALCASGAITVLTGVPGLRPELLTSTFLGVVSLGFWGVAATGHGRCAPVFAGAALTLAALGVIAGPALPPVVGSAMALSTALLATASGACVLVRVHNQSRQLSR